VVRRPAYRLSAAGHHVVTDRRDIIPRMLFLYPGAGVPAVAIDVDALDKMTSFL
jgi:hypothetical protein